MKMLACIAVAGLATPALAQYTQELGMGAGDEGVQVEVDGAQTGAFFMNAQGSGNGGFAEFYVMRFDLSDYAGGDVANVEIDLRHAEIFFSESGLTQLSYSADDATDLSGLTFDSMSIGGNNGQLAASVAATFDFIDLPGDDTTTIDTITLNDVGGLFADIASGGIITLVLEAAEADTSATYGGIGSFDGGPVIRVTPVPAPAATALLGLGGLVAARRRRA